MTNKDPNLLLPKGLIVSCQAPTDSPLYHPEVIAAMAQASILQGAVGVRINTCLLYTSPSPRDKRQSRMPSSA